MFFKYLFDNISTGTGGFLVGKRETMAAFVYYAQITQSPQLATYAMLSTLIFQNKSLKLSSGCRHIREAIEKGIWLISLSMSNRDALEHRGFKIRVNKRIFFRLSPAISVRLYSQNIF